MNIGRRVATDTLDQLAQPRHATTACRANTTQLESVVHRFYSQFP